MQYGTKLERLQQSICDPIIPIQANMCSYKPRQINRYQYIPQFSQQCSLYVGINMFCVWIHAQYLTNIYQYKPNYMPILVWGKIQCAAPKLNTCHYIPNTCQYIPIHTTIHARYIPRLDWFSTRVFAQRTSIGMYPGMYW